MNISQAADLISQQEQAQYDAMQAQMDELTWKQISGETLTRQEQASLNAIGKQMADWDEEVKNRIAKAGGVKLGF